MWAQSVPTGLAHLGQSCSAKPRAASKSFCGSALTVCCKPLKRKRLFASSPATSKSSKPKTFQIAKTAVPAMSRESSPVREHRCKLCKTPKTSAGLLCAECQEIKNVAPGFRKVMNVINDGPRFTLCAGNILWYVDGRGGTLQQVFESLEEAETILSEIIETCGALREQVHSLVSEKQS